MDSTLYAKLRENAIKSIMRQAGLSDWDRESVEMDVDAVLKVFKKYLKENPDAE